MTMTRKKTKNPVAGVVGLGLMGTSIAACLLIAGHEVRGVEPDPEKRRTVRARLLKLLHGAQTAGLLRERPIDVLSRFFVSRSVRVLAEAEIVVESTVESVAVKRSVMQKVEKVVSART